MSAAARRRLPLRLAAMSPICLLVSAVTSPGAAAAVRPVPSVSALVITKAPSPNAPLARRHAQNRRPRHTAPHQHVPHQHVPHEHVPHQHVPHSNLNRAPLPLRVVTRFDQLQARQFEARMPALTRHESHATVHQTLAGRNGSVVILAALVLLAGGLVAAQVGRRTPE